MLLPNLRRGARRRVYADDCLGRLCKALDDARVSYPAGHPELGLARLPFARAPQSEPTGCVIERFRAPLRAPAEVTMLEAGFASGPGLREIRAAEIDTLADAEPAALVTPLNLSLFLAEHRRKPAVVDWMVVLTSLSGPAFGPEQRDLLWRAFGVPVFEQLRGWDGGVIARECEVHDGLHVDEDRAIPETHEGELIATVLASRPILRARTGLAAEIAREHCECGGETARIRNLAMIREKARYAVA